MGLLKKALLLKVGRTAYNQYNRRRGGGARPGTGAGTRSGPRSGGGGLARLAESFLGGGRRRRR